MPKKAYKLVMIGVGIDGKKEKYYYSLGKRFVVYGGKVMMHGIKNTSNDTFSRLMGNGLRYNVPKYQRDYSWDKEQWSDLWYDVLQMIEEQDSHYMGYLVLQTNDDKNYQIIDGQQRLTTLCILILAVVDYLKKLPGTEEERKANEMRAQNIHTSYIGNFIMSP